MSSVLQDVRYAARRLARTPVFSVAAAAILAIGIGLNATVFSLVDATLLRPAPFADLDRLVQVYQDSDGGEPASTSFPAYREMTAYTDVFAAVAATSGGDAVWDTGDAPRRVAVEFATASYFPALGLDAQLGRWFAPEHDRVGAELVAVISHRTWRAQLNSDPAVVGRAVRLNNRPVTVIGVGPPDFNSQASGQGVDFWLSISSTPVGGAFRVANLERSQDHWYQVKARLAPDATIVQAQAAMDRLALRLAELEPEIDAGRGISVFAHGAVRVHPALDTALFAGGTSMLILATLVLLLACSNLANLFLARGMSRGPEVAVRTALGAGWGRIARLLLIEALLLAGAGGLLGLAVAAALVHVLPGLPLGLPVGGLDVRFDERVIVFGVLAALATGLVFGLIPALRCAGTDIVAALRDEGRGVTAGGGISLFRKALVAVQVALSAVLVVAAALMAQSLANVERVDVGVDLERIALVDTNLAQGGVEPEQAGAVAAQLLARLAAVPGVERVAITTRLPVHAGGGSTSTIVDRYAPEAGTGAIELPVAFVSRDYFATMGIRLLDGRTFSAADSPQTRPVAVVNETAARLYWGGNAVGGRNRPQTAPDAWREIVGVVADVKVAALDERPTPMLYLSADQAPQSVFTMVARASGEAAVAAAELARALREVRPALPIVRQGTLDEHIGNVQATARAVVTLTSGFSLLALALAAVGIYAAVAFNVQRRTHEVGVRMALGATQSRVMRMVVGESVGVVALGVAVGLVLAAVIARGMAPLVLYGVGPLDAPTFAGAAALLVVTSAVAALLPARRAARTNPAATLSVH